MSICTRYAPLFPLRRQSALLTVRQVATGPPRKSLFRLLHSDLHRKPRDAQAPWCF